MITKFQQALKIEIEEENGFLFYYN